MKITDNLSIKDFIKVVRENEQVELSKDAIDRINRARGYIDEAIKSGQTIYGVNTGFGELSHVRIEDKDLNQLQTNLIRSHAAGVGKPLPEEIVRGAILLLINSLSKGHSGIRKVVVEHLIKLLNLKITPIVPSIGSLGASGDLAPLAHIMKSGLFGEGNVNYNNQIISGIDAFKQTGLTPITLTAKEGLALINGTHVMLSLGLSTLIDSYNIMNHAIIATALSTDTLRGTDAAFDTKVHLLRPHKGQMRVAECLFNLMKGSEIRLSHLEEDTRVQDAYSERCSPQVLGASLDTFDFVKNIFIVEMNSVTDNPLILDDGTIQSAGHFHGQPIALALDYLSIALSEIGNISERRINRLLDTSLSGLPPFLAKNPGLNSGLMIAQYTAAALVSQNKTLSHPSSVDSIPVSADKEDHVSMGMNAALKANNILHNLEDIICIELLCSTQGLEFIQEYKTSIPLQKVVLEIRKIVKPIEQDRSTSADLVNFKKLLNERKLIEVIKSYVSIIKL